MKKDVLESFREIQIESPSDKIIRQIRELISSGQLKSGDKLPSERQLCERLGVGRTHVRDAIKKLEFYGILKTLPQSGTVVSGLGITALKGLITDILKLEKNDFFSLVETRVLMEAEATRLAALRRTNEDILNIQNALQVFRDKAKGGNPAIEEDFLFHLQIAEASKNSVIKSLMLIVTPEIMQKYNELKVCSDGVSMKSFKDHQDIFNFIKDKNADAAMSAMTKHLKGVLEFSRKTNL